jgi:hypothetical protein
MAIDATISHRGTDDEYDLDIVELDIDPAAAPDEVLDLLHRAFKGYALLLDVQRPLSLGTS